MGLNYQLSDRDWHYGLDKQPWTIPDHLITSIHSLVRSRKGRGARVIPTLFIQHTSYNLIKIRSFGPLPYIASNGSNETPYKG